MTEPLLSLFSLRYVPAGVADLDGLNLRLVEAINMDGLIYVTQTRVDGEIVLRFQAGQFECTERDVAAAYEVITEIPVLLLGITVESSGLIAWVLLGTAILSGAARSSGGQVSVLGGGTPKSTRTGQGAIHSSPCRTGLSREAVVDQAEDHNHNQPEHNTSSSKEQTNLTART